MRRKVILIIISILILTLSILGITYAFMRPQVEQKEEKSNITINACAKIQLKDNGNSINLENTYPLDDEMGLKTKPYEFTITSTCDDYVDFNLYLTSLTDNEIEDNNIHFAITSQENTVLVSDVLSKATNALTEFNTDELKELDLGIKGTHKNIYKVYSNNIPLKDESVYKLYLWLDKDASNDTMGKSFKVGLSIKSFNREETYADNCDKSLATCEIAKKVYENNTLFYHDANLKNGAEDLSYRFSGSSDKVNNYVCLDSKTTGECETDEDLYRIIGLFKNETDNYEMKLIKAQGATAIELGNDEIEGGAYKDLNKLIDDNSDYQSYYKGTNWETLAGYYWNSSLGTSKNSNNVNVWQESNLNKVNLNDFYYNYITNRATYLQNHITEHMWTVGGSYGTGNAKERYNMELGDEKVKVGDNLCYLPDDGITTRPCTQEDIEYKNHIGLMYRSDYMYGTLPVNWSLSTSQSYMNNNWLYIGTWEWLITRRTYDGFTALRIGGLGTLDSSYVYYAFVVRPCFYLSSDAKITYDLELGNNKVKVGDNVCYTQDNSNNKKACTQEDIEYKAHIGLMYISDYMYGATPNNWTTLAINYNETTVNNWLYVDIKETEWVISRASSYSNYGRYVNDKGIANNGYNVYSYYMVRPSFYLSSDARIKEGNGTKKIPYRITFE